MESTTQRHIKINLKELREILAKHVSDVEDQEIDPESISDLDSLIRNESSPSIYPSDSIDISHFNGVKFTINS